MTDSLSKVKLREIVDNLMRGGRFLAMLTPTKVDDDVLDWLDDHLVNEDWFYDIVVFLVDLFDRDPDTAEKLVAKLIEADTTKLKEVVN